MEATPNKDTLTAGVDLGSNSFRLMIAEITPTRIKPLRKILRNIQLGEGLSKSNSLTSEATARALAALAEFRVELDKFPAAKVRCCGTEALRRAENSSSFIAKASIILNCTIEIINSSEEALLSCRGVLSSLAGNIDFPIMIADVGGSSTEIIFIAASEKQPVTTSFPFGALINRELFIADKLPMALAELSTRLKKFSEKNSLDKPHTLIGTGGTATALATIDLDLKKYDPGKIQGRFLATNNIKRIVSTLDALPPERRCLLPGLDHGRGNIIVAGIEIYQEIIATIGVEGMIVSDSGLLEGILLSAVENKSTNSKEIC